MEIIVESGALILGIIVLIIMTHNLKKLFSLWVKSPSTSKYVYPLFET